MMTLLEIEKIRVKTWRGDHHLVSDGDVMYGSGAQRRGHQQMYTFTVFDALI